jgi:hypothetical protein
MGLIRYAMRMEASQSKSNGKSSEHHWHRNLQDNGFWCSHRGSPASSLAPAHWEKRSVRAENLISVLAVTLEGLLPWLPVLIAIYGLIAYEAFFE